MQKIRFWIPKCDKSEQSHNPDMHVSAKLSERAQSGLEYGEQADVPEAHGALPVLRQAASRQWLIHLRNQLVQHSQSQEVVV